MAEMKLQLLKGEKVASNVEYRSALAVNVSGVVEAIMGADGYLLQQPGLTQYATGLGKDRGGIWNERMQEHFRISGSRLIKVDADGTIADLGAIAGTGRASLPYSFNTQGIIAGGRFYLWNGLTLVNVGVNPASTVDVSVTTAAIGTYIGFSDGSLISAGGSAAPTELLGNTIAQIAMNSGGNPDFLTIAIDNVTDQDFYTAVVVEGAGTYFTADASFVPADGSTPAQWTWTEDPTPWGPGETYNVGFVLSVTSSSGDVGNPIDGVWVDGYYFLTDGEYLYHTRLQNEAEIDPLDFATSEFSPDPTLGVGLTTDNKVIAFNRYSTEYFVNQANPNFAFTRLPSRSLKYGIVGTHCKCEIGGNWFFMGGPKEGSVSIYALGVGQVEEIASREVVKVINQYSEEELSGSILEARVVDEYKYLIIHLPNDTLLFNFKVASLGGKDYAWSILKSGIHLVHDWRAVNGIFEPRKGVWVYGDKWQNKIGILDETVGTHYGELVECIMFTPFVYLEEMSIDELEIFTIPGFVAPNQPPKLPEPEAPTITVQPSSGLFPLTLTVTATGDPTLFYQWQEFTGGEWVDIAGETSDTYEDAPEGTYRVLVLNYAGQTFSESALAYGPVNADFIDQIDLDFTNPGMASVDPITGTIAVSRATFGQIYLYNPEPFAFDQVIVPPAGGGGSDSQNIGFTISNAGDILVPRQASFGEVTVRRMDGLSETPVEDIGTGLSGISYLPYLLFDRDANNMVGWMRGPDEYITFDGVSGDILSNVEKEFVIGASLYQGVLYYPESDGATVIEGYDMDGNKVQEINVSEPTSVVSFTPDGVLIGVGSDLGTWRITRYSVDLP